MSVETQEGAHDLRRGMAKTFLAGGLFLAMVGILAALTYPDLRDTGAAQIEPPAAARAVGRVSSVNGSVGLRRRDQAFWTAAASGISICDGDMVQTGGSGSLTIQYTDASTVTIPANTLLSIHHTAEPAMAETPAPRAEARPEAPKPQPATEQPRAQDRNVEQSQPTLQLDRIIAFGRTLELIGCVDPGSAFYIDDESVEVSGSGTFKHFTKPFPSGKSPVKLTLRVVDLRGRVRVMNATHNFGTDSGEK